MSENFLYSTLPACELTKERLQRLLELTEEQLFEPPEDGTLDEEQVEIARGEVRQAIENLPRFIEKGGEVVSLHFEGMLYRTWITGCMSWGEINAASEVFEEINRFPVIYFQLLEWAKADFAKNPETEPPSNIASICLG
jgi:pentatricopeptide repeat protein